MVNVLLNCNDNEKQIIFLPEFFIDTNLLIKLVPTFWALDTTSVSIEDSIMSGRTNTLCGSKY